MPKPLKVESPETRKEFIQCQQCYKNKTRAKLFVCTGCKVALYCSTACQKANWSFHKAACKQHQERLSHFASLDNQVLSIASTSEATDVPVALLPSELMEELRAFMNKFGPALFQAGFNCVDIANHSMGWTQMVCYVMLERLTNIPGPSHRWSRFRVTTVERFPLITLHMIWGAEQMKDFLKAKQAQERRHREAGFLGSIAIVLTCSYKGSGPPLVVHNMAFQGFGAHSQSELKIEDAWKETFMETVERMCGRGAPGLPAVDGSYGALEPDEPSGESYLTSPD